MMWPKPTMTMFQKVHTFQASLESVLTQLCEAEVAQKSLTNCDTDPNTFRNQLKVTICPPVIPTVSPAGLEVPHSGVSGVSVRKNSGAHPPSCN